MCTAAMTDVGFFDLGHGGLSKDHRRGPSFMGQWRTARGDAETRRDGPNR